ncbi:class II aldolase/adducin family protein [Candidatus Poriferisocius sp.]|uniref:class II aldolase/adducin family protein n=1 Tax=Candidatus Poriferisocius sp. TaxID=3101276 RepID=UPI003B02CEAC
MTGYGLKHATAGTARMLAASKLVEAFGHVSARLPGGGFLITSTKPTLEATADSVVTVDADGTVVEDPSGAAPLEIPMHAGIYRSRPDVAAICRGHGPAMVAWGVAAEDVPLLHGLGAIAGAVVPVHPDLNLITTQESGDRLALTLGHHHCALLLSNGGLAVGADLLEAATRLWFLEERAKVALAARRTEPAAGNWDQRMTYTDVELIRAKAWFKARFGPADPIFDPE